MGEKIVLGFGNNIDYEIVWDSQVFESKITLGGTSVRAAIAMNKIGYISALHLVTTNDHVRKLIPQSSPYVSSSQKNSCYPHLIIQFHKGTRVKSSDIDICTSHANRIIYHNDYDNIATVIRFCKHIGYEGYY